jgi:hypothetical protein
VTMALTTIVFSCPFLVMKIETSFMSPLNCSSSGCCCESLFYSPPSLILDGDLMLESSLT